MHKMYDIHILKYFSVILEFALINMAGMRMHIFG